MSGFWRNTFLWFMFGKNMTVIDYTNEQLCDELERLAEHLDDEYDVILIAEAIDRLNPPELTETENLGEN